MSLTRSKIAPKAPQYNRQVVDFVGSLQRSLGLTREDLSDTLKLNDREFEHFVSLRRELTINQFAALARKYRFSLEGFEAGTVDFQALARQRAGDRCYLPKKYTVGGFSKRIMIINVLNYLEAHYPAALKNDLMVHFHITDAIYADREGGMNVVFFEEVMRYLKSRGLGDSDIHAIGVHTITTNQETDFARTMGSFASPRQMFERYMADLIKTVERNNVYVIKSIDDLECEVESHDNPELQELFKVKHPGGRFRCSYRVGALSAATTYMGLPLAQVTETKCIHRGDPVCMFLIDFERPNHHLRHRPFPFGKREIA